MKDNRSIISIRRLCRGLSALTAACLCASSSMAYAASANSAELVLTELLEQNGDYAMQIVVSGHGETAGTPVAFYLVNEEGEPAHYDQTMLDQEGGYRFGFLVNPEFGSGTFTYQVKPKHQPVQTGTIEIVGVNGLVDLLTYIKAGVPSATDLEERIAQVDLAINMPFYKNISQRELSRIIYAVLSEEAAPTDVGALYQLIQQSVVVSGINSCPDALFSNGRFQYGELLGLDEKSSEIYATELTDKGLAGVKNGLSAADYSSISKCVSALKKLILTNCITNNASGDLEEAQTRLLTYGAELGLDLSKAAGKERQVTRAIINAGCTTPAKLTEAYNAAVKTSDSDGSGSGSNGGKGGSSSGGGSSGGGAGYQPAVQPNSNGNQPGGIAVVSGFADMADYAWAEEAVASLRNRGIVNGKTETEFAPDDAVTREEFVKMVMEGFELMPTGESDTELETRFTDVNTDKWYAAYVIRAASLGVVTGISEEEFGIGQQISRQDMATLAFRAMRYRSSSLDTDLTDISFTDIADIAEYAKTPTLLLKKLNILSGYPDGSFQPGQTANRAEAAQMMYRILALQ